jgi:2-polyprenyl-3-methyl-5-hydroxy-6-metoxy-1,4-benzoquinol methylase
VTLQDTYAIEVAKWDALAGAAPSDASLRVADADFGAHARRVRTMPGVAEFLGDLRGREVLEYGCGLGALTTLLALSGANVSAFDLSPASVETARRRARLHGVEDAIEFHVAAGESLPYPDEHFDVVVGKAILHHLDVTLAAPELYRVLRPGGRAAFSEPLGTNPVVAFARDHVPYARKNVRGADHPLQAADVDAWGAPFREFRHREIQLLAMVERALGLQEIRALWSADEWLLDHWPALGRWCRYVVLTMVK